MRTRNAAVGRILALGVLAGLLLLLSGCQVLLLPLAVAAQKEGEKVDPEMDRVVRELTDAVARDDEEAFAALFYPGKRTGEELRTSFAGLRQMCPWEQDYVLEHVLSGPTVAGSGTASYTIRFEEVWYEVTIFYQKDDGGEGIDMLVSSFRA